MKGSIWLDGQRVGEGTDITFRVATDLAGLDDATIMFAQFNDALRQLEVTMKLTNVGFKEFDWALNWYKDPGSAWWEQ